jgi:hypothetical protein
VLQPSFERNLKVHHRKEGVHTIFLLDDIVEDALIVQVSFTLVLDG